jgi:hypothetical protein
MTRLRRQAMTCGPLPVRTCTLNFQRFGTGMRPTAARRNARGLRDRQAEVIAAAERGIARIRAAHHLAFSFSRYCGLSLW